MIKLYYTSSEKYLEKGKYLKYFDETATIDSMLECIKDKEAPVTIYALADNVITHQYGETTKKNYTYKILKKKQTLDEDIVKTDLEKLYEGVVSYSLYEPKPEWQPILGKEVYLTNSPELKHSLISQKKKLAFLLSDLRELVHGLKTVGQIPRSLLVKMVFEGKEV